MMISNKKVDCNDSSITQTLIIENTVKPDRNGKHFEDHIDDLVQDCSIPVR